MLNLARRALAAPAVALAMAAGTLSVSAPAQAADMDCGDFGSQRSAQIFFLNHGGPGSDPHRLDSAGDGVACESNPAPYYYGTSLPDSTQPDPKPARA